MTTRRQFLRSGQAMALAGLPFWSNRSIAGCDTAASDQAPPLKVQAERIGKMFGSAADRDVLSHDPEYRKVLIDECSMVTPENSMKWERLRPEPGGFFFDDADWLVDFAIDHDLAVRGHALVWHLQLPAWLDDVMNPANAEKLMVDHIETVAGRYAGRIHSWDVVNEVVAVDHDRPDGLRLTPWLKHLGPDHIDLAFHAAAAADPHAILVYNEIGLEYDDDHGKMKCGQVLDLLASLVARDAPVHALGLQAHLEADFPTDFTLLDRFLKDIADLGLGVMITELDVSDQALPGDIKTRDCRVADTYRAFLDVVTGHEHVMSIGVWGLSDRYSWLSEFAPRDDGAPNRPLPLDHDLNRKPAWSAISEALASASQ